MAKKITIDTVAQMTVQEFTAMRKEIVTKDMFKEGIRLVLDEVGGLRGDVKTWHQESRIEISELRERMDILEKRMTRVEATARR